MSIYIHTYLYSTDMKIPTTTPQLTSPQDSIPFPSSPLLLKSSYSSSSLLLLHRRLTTTLPKKVFVLFAKGEEVEGGGRGE